MMVNNKRKRIPRFMSVPEDPDTEEEEEKQP